MRTFLFILAAAACSGKEQPAVTTADDALADAAASQSLPTEHYLSPIERFDLSLPGAWTGKYRVTEKKDTTAGARLAVEFRFLPDRGSRAPSHPLIVMRIFPKPVWDAHLASGAPPLGAKIGERGTDVFVLMLPASNPYPAHSAEALTYDRLIISIAQGGQQVHIAAQR